MLAFTFAPSLFFSFFHYIHSLPLFIQFNSFPCIACSYLISSSSSAYSPAYPSNPLAFSSPFHYPSILYAIPPHHLAQTHLFSFFPSIYAHHKTRLIIHTGPIFPPPKSCWAHHTRMLLSHMRISYIGINPHLLLQILLPPLLLLLLLTTFSSFLVDQHKPSFFIIHNP